MRQFLAAYSKNMFVGLLSALVSPSRAMAIEDEKERISYPTVVKNFGYSLVPFIIVAGTLALTWWYVVIHPQVGPEAAVEGVQQLGTLGITKKAVDADLGPPAAFYWWFAGIALV